MGTSTHFNDGLRKYTEAEERILNARLQAVRATITHPAEKGRSVEHAVRNFLRALLPAEYGLSTGFIASHLRECVHERDIEIDGTPAYECRYCHDDDRVDTSSQVDVIIYDALRFGPIV